MPRVEYTPFRAGLPRLLGLWLAICLLPSTAFALDLSKRLNQLHHTSWTAKDGLTGSALSLAQTADGFLWIGTTDGLFRFDGVSFERFRPQGGELPALSVSALLGVPDGGLWVGYTRGRASFISNSGQVVNYSEKEGLPVAKVRSLARTPDGAVWAAVVGGLARFDGSRWKKVRMDWNYPCSSAWKLFVDRQGTLWVGAASPDGAYFLPKGGRAFQDTGLRGIVNAIAQTADGTILVADDDQTSLFVAPRGDGAPRDVRSITDISGFQFIVDRDGGVWAAAHDIVRARFPDRGSKRSVYRVEPSDSFTWKDGLSGSVANDVLEDREGNVWVATGGGLDRFRDRNLTWERQRTDGAVVNLAVDGDGDVWAVSQWEPSLVRVRDRKIVRNAPEVLYAGYRAPDGSIWLAAADSFLRFEHGRFSKIQPPEMAVAKGIRFRVLAATWDRTGRAWVSIGGLGQFYLQEGKWTFVEVLPGRSDLTAVAAYADAADRVWLAYRDNLAVIERGKVRVFSKADGLDLGALVTLGGRDGAVLVGGEFGLALWHGDRFHMVRASRGTGFGSVSAIMVVPSGVWLSTSAGIVHIPEREFQKVCDDPQYLVDYEVLDVVSDLPEPLAGRSGGEPAVVGTDGVLWFWTANGVARVDPGRITRNPLPPPVVIRSVVADDKAYSPQQASVALPALTKAIRIVYSGLSLAIPERVKFRYRLQGWESDWHDVGTDRAASYTQLGPGTYGFQVIASNNDGVWNESGATLAFTVAPAWFQTAWFKVLVALSIGLLLLLLYRIRVRQVSAALAARFDARLAERTRLARDLHDTLLQTVQVSKMTADDALDDAPDFDRLRGAMRQLSEWLAQAVSEGRAALNSLRTSTVEVNDLADAFRRAASSGLKPEALTVSVEVRGGARDLHPIVRDEIYRIGYEAIRNAFAHSRGTRLEIRLDYASDLTLVIADNGIGIDPIVSDKGKEGRFGLSGMRERAAAVGGVLTVTSSGAGTTIALVVPGRAVFRGERAMIATHDRYNDHN
jgi:signal transduction histidine kinase/ligand-binding sensor domain-containing protein